MENGPVLIGIINRKGRVSLIWYMWKFHFIQHPSKQLEHQYLCIFDLVIPLLGVSSKNGMEEAG